MSDSEEGYTLEQIQEWEAKVVKLHEKLRRVEQEIAAANDRREERKKARNA